MKMLLAGDQSDPEADIDGRTVDLVLGADTNDFNVSILFQEKNPFGNKRVCLSLYKEADTPFHFQVDCR